MSTDEELPAVLREDVLRNPHEDSWKPLTGPFWWERNVRGQEVTWMDDRMNRDGLVIRDVESDSAEEFIISDTYVHDLRGHR